MWEKLSDKFDAECRANPNFANVEGKMLNVLDGNHRLYSWMELLREFPTDQKYHPNVVAILLQCPTKALVEVEMAMHARNTYVSLAHFQRM